LQEEYPPLTMAKGCRPGFLRSISSPIPESPNIVFQSFKADIPVLHPNFLAPGFKEALYTHPVRDYSRCIMDQRKDIIRKNLRKENSARQGLFPLIDVAFAAAHAGRQIGDLELAPRQHADALIHCLRTLPVDGIYINLCFDEAQARNAVKTETGYTLLLDDAVEIRLPPNDVASIQNSRITSFQDSRFRSAELFHPGMLATWNAMKTADCPDAAVAVGLTGSFSQVGFLLGVEALMMAVLDDPGAVRKAIEIRHRVALRQIHDFARAGAEFIWVGEGMASGSLISPAIYRQIVLPFEQELAAEIRRLGMLSILHICGNTTPMLPDIAQSGFDGFDLDYPVNLHPALRELARHLTIKGNIDPSLFLPGRNPQLRQACEQIRLAVPPDHPFIISTGCLVPRDSSPEAFTRVAAFFHPSTGRCVTVR